MRKLFLGLVLAAASLPASAALPTGARAPDFSTTGALAGKPFRLHLKEQLRKGPVVLYFFPKAFTQGCTLEARAFSEANADLRLFGDQEADTTFLEKTRGQTRRARHVELHESKAVGEVLQRLSRKGFSVEHYAAQDQPLFELVEGEGRVPMQIYSQTADFDIPGERLKEVTLAFKIPPDVPGTDLDREDAVYWQVAVRVPVVGPDLELVYLAPVYAPKT